MQRDVGCFTYLSIWGARTALCYALAPEDGSGTMSTLASCAHNEPKVQFPRVSKAIVKRPNHWYNRGEWGTGYGLRGIRRTGLPQLRVHR